MDSLEAVFRDGSRQYKVAEGTTVDLDYRDVKPGSTLEFDDVLYVKGGKGAPRVGNPAVEGARVVGKVVRHVKGPKLIVMQFRRRKHSKSRVGHRQPLTRVRIEKIEAS